MRLELQAVIAVVDPDSGGGDPFSGRDRRGVPYRRYQVPLAACLDAQDAEAVVGVMECNALDEPREYFALLILMLMFHGNIRSCSRLWRCDHNR